MTCANPPARATVSLAANAYCDRLGITPPRLLDVAIGPSRKHLDALVLVLLATGEPMELDEIVGVLAPMWDGTPLDLRVTLQKAWAGREPVVKDGTAAHARRVGARDQSRSAPPYREVDAVDGGRDDPDAARARRSSSLVELELEAA